jgi:hypothetical protein
MKFHGLFILRSLFLHCCCWGYWDFECLFFVNVDFFWAKKQKVKRASHFVKIILACPHRLPKLPESTQRKQAIPNMGSLFYSHCGKQFELLRRWLELHTLHVHRGWSVDNRLSFCTFSQPWKKWFPTFLCLQIIHLQHFRINRIPKTNVV